MARLTETDDRYLLHIDKSQKERAKAISGRCWINSHKAWGYPKTQEVYEALLAEFGDGLDDQTVKQRPLRMPSLQDTAAIFSNGIVTAGSGPYEESDFDTILRKLGINVFELGSQGFKVLVLGRGDWDEDTVNKHIESRREEELCLYSQEMFLAHLATGQDPHDDSELLEAFGEGHPAFEYLSDWGFDWPRTTIVPGIGLPSTGGGDPTSWPQVGLLKHLGYTVGSNGVSRWERQRILRAVFTESVPNVQSQAYMNEWGTPKSSTRLQKLAKSIASFARNAQRKESPPEEAIREWEQDLAWLQETFYRGRFKFYWPST